MVGRNSFPLAFLDWLALISSRLEVIESSAGESEGISPLREFARELWRVRRECEVLDLSLDALVQNGQIRAIQRAQIRELLHDLRWLLEISPYAPPALVRQCVRIAQDRIADEAHALPDELSEATLRMIQSFAVA
jgi:hypothetical protein